MENHNKTWNLAEQILREAKQDVREETIARLKERMVGLYRRLAEAKSIVINVEREIEIAEAEILRVVG